MRTPIDATGHSGATVALLNSGAPFVMADLYTITLSGGGVIRWTGHSAPLTFNGATWLSGPVFQRGKVSHKVGTQVSTLEITLAANSSDLINGTPLLPFIAGKGFDGAQLKLEKAFLPSWSSPITGTLIDFSGFITSIKNVSRAAATLTVSSGMVRLNVKMGPDLYQASCLNVLFSVNCGLIKASFAVSGAVAASSPTISTFNTNLTASDGYYSQGVILFTSGANNGVQRAATSYVHASGNMTLAFPLPVAPAVGDTFTAWPGCDHTLATCKAKFGSDNSLNFRGQPFIPTPETGL